MMVNNKKGRKGAGASPVRQQPVAAAIVCAECDTGSGDFLTCKVCNDHFHPACVDISDDVYTAMVPILPKIGWVCNECVSLLSSTRTSMKKDIESMRSIIEKQDSILTTLTTKLEALTTRVEGLVKSSASPEIKATSMLTSNGKQPLNDNRRFNVIVSGLKESSDDKVIVNNILRGALNIQPIISSCKRVGKVIPDRPRKLLVTFAHASSRDDVLALARQLKLSTLPTAKDVFINPDLSPEESKAAYEMRQAKKRNSPLDGTHASLAATTSVNI